MPSAPARSSLAKAGNPQSPGFHTKIRVHWRPFVVKSSSLHKCSSSLKRRLFPKRKDEKPRRSSVRIPSVADNSAIQTRVASGKSIGISAYLLMSRTAAASASALKASLTSVALASRKRARLAAPCGLDYHEETIACAEPPPRKVTVSQGPRRGGRSDTNWNCLKSSAIREAHSWLPGWEIFCVTRHEEAILADRARPDNGMRFSEENRKSRMDLVLRCRFDI